MITKNDVNNLLDSLSESKFRGSFHLNDKMIKYSKEKGYKKIQNDAYDIVISRLSKKNIVNDGRQTPMRQVHPVFIAQHATGTCCRGCIEKIHHIKNNKELSCDETNYIVYVIMTWIVREINKN